jgi:hypothetical protein
MTSTSICWWCCHSCHSTVLNMPISHDEYKNVFQTFGYFCSFECMKAYNLHDNDSNKCIRSSLISLFRQKSYANFDKIAIAPPKQLLKIFGGSMSIESFRSSFEDTSMYVIHYPPIIPIAHIVEKQNNFKWIKHDETNEKLHEQQTMNNNPIKIKKKHSEPIKTQNPLEMVLGIFPQQR